MLERTIQDGSAYKKLLAMIAAQGGDTSYLDRPGKFPVAHRLIDVKADQSGYVKEINALTIGESSTKLGAGRAKKEDVIDYTAGIVLQTKVGQHVVNGATLAVVHTNKEDVDDILQAIKAAFVIQKEPVKPGPIVYEVIE